MVSSIVRSVDRTKEATMGNKDNNYILYLNACRHPKHRQQTLLTQNSQVNRYTAWWLNTGSILYLKNLCFYAVRMTDTHASTINYLEMYLSVWLWLKRCWRLVQIEALVQWALELSSELLTLPTLSESLPAVKVIVRAQGWPMTQIFKQGPTVALASVSSNLPALQRRQTNWLASGA